MAPLHPRNDTVITASNGATLSLNDVATQQVHLASMCTNYGVQLGLTLMMLLTLLFLSPVPRLRKRIHLVHISSLIVSVVRLGLLTEYFPAALSEYYATWSRGVHAPDWTDIDTNAAGGACTVLQFALIETTLVLQSWSLIKTWPDLWQWIIQIASVAFAAATIAVKIAWVVHHSWMEPGATAPLRQDGVGQAATVLGAVSIFIFCGVFCMTLCYHLVITRGILTARMDRGRKCLKIMTVGNLILMIMPVIFAGLDITVRLMDTRIVPFDAASWSMTLVVIGLPLTGQVAGYHAPESSSHPSRRTVQLVRPILPSDAILHSDTMLRTLRTQGTSSDSPLRSSSAGSFIPTAGAFGIFGKGSQKLKDSKLLPRRRSNNELKADFRI